MGKKKAGVAGLTARRASVITKTRRMAPTERSRFFQMRISDEELRMLNAIAEADGLSASDVVRQLIRRSFTERWPSKPKR